MVGNCISDKIRRTVSSSNTKQAVAEIATELQASEKDLVICFVSQSHRPDELQELFREHFNNTTLIACRTAGEITPAGYIDNSLTAVVLPATLFTAEIMLLEDLQSITINQVSELTKQTCHRLETKTGENFSPASCFAMLLIDGLSLREEMVSAGVDHALGDIPLFGGSAADNVNFENAWIFHKNAMYQDSAALLLIHSQLPFEVFKTEHFSSGENTYVSTSANTADRTILEVDGFPAAQWYAQTLGLKISELNTDIFSRNPVTVHIGGKTYVRAIQCVEENGGLRFYCAIDEGMILHIGQRGDLLDNLSNKLTQVAEQLGNIELLIGFDCMIRNLEAKNDNLIPALSELFIRYNTIGFATFGEQLSGMHINQTFTGIAIGKQARAS